ARALTLHRAARGVHAAGVTLVQRRVGLEVNGALNRQQVADPLAGGAVKDRGEIYGLTNQHGAAVKTATLHAGKLRGKLPVCHSANVRQLGLAVEIADTSPARFP